MKGTTWSYISIDSFSLESYDAYSWVFGNPKELSYDASALKLNQTHLNSIKLRIRSLFTNFYAPYMSVDYVSVEVAYTTPTEGTLPDGFILGIIILLPSTLIFAIALKKHH